MGQDYTNSPGQFPDFTRDNLGKAYKQAGQIQGALESLNSARLSLTSELAGLADQLKRVLRPGMPTVPECPSMPMPPQAPSSDLAQTIDNEVRALRELVDQVRDMTQRLDL